MFPMVPLGSNLNLGLAIVSYSGTLNFGLVGDFNAGHRRSSRSDVRDPCFVVRQTRRPGRLFPRIARKARLSGRSHSSPTARTARDCIGREPEPALNRLAPTSAAAWAGGEPRVSGPFAADRHC